MVRLLEFLFCNKNDISSLFSLIQLKSNIKFFCFTVIKTFFWSFGITLKIVNLIIKNSEDLVFLNLQRKTRNIFPSSSSIHLPQRLPSRRVRLKTTTCYNRKQFSLRQGNYFAHFYCIFSADSVFRFSVYFPPAMQILTLQTWEKFYSYLFFPLEHSFTPGRLLVLRVKRI